MHGMSENLGIFSLDHTMSAGNPDSLPIANQKGEHIMAPRILVGRIELGEVIPFSEDLNTHRIRKAEPPTELALCIQHSVLLM